MFYWTCLVKQCKVWQFRQCCVVMYMVTEKIRTPYVSRAQGIIMCEAHVVWYTSIAYMSMPDIFAISCMNPNSLSLRFLCLQFMGTASKTRVFWVGVFISSQWDVCWRVTQPLKGPVIKAPGQLWPENVPKLHEMVINTHKIKVRLEKTDNVQERESAMKVNHGVS